MSSSRADEALETEKALNELMQYLEEDQSTISSKEKTMRMIVKMIVKWRGQVILK